MGIGLARIRQVKIPVTDLAGSVDWYRRALGLDLAAEFVEQDVLRGVALADPDTGFVVALRDRSVCANEPDLAGYDVVAFEITDPDKIVARWDDLGLDHTDVWDGGHYGLGVDLRDPDGIVLRFLCGNPIGQGGFAGVATDADGRFSFYETPRLG